jgi:hypothetical protein
MEGSSGPLTYFHYTAVCLHLIASEASSWIWIKWRHTCLYLFSRKIIRLPWWRRPSKSSFDSRCSSTQFKSPCSHYALPNTEIDSRLISNGWLSAWHVRYAVDLKSRRHSYLLLVLNITAPCEEGNAYYYVQTGWQFMNMYEVIGASGAVGWGTAPQDGRFWVRFAVVSLKIFKCPLPSVRIQ